MARQDLVVYLRTILVACVVVLSSAFSLLAQEPPSAVGSVLKLFLSGRLPPERQGTVVEMICSRGNEHDLRVVFDRVLQPDGFAPQLRHQAIEWLTDAAATRKQKPSGDLAGIERILGDTDPKLRLAAIRLASAWRLESAAKILAEYALSKKSSGELQRASIEGLIALGDSTSKSGLLQLSGEDYAVGVRSLAVGGLAGLDLKLAGEKAAEILSQVDSNDDLSDMLQSFLDRKDGADALAVALTKAKLNADVAKKALRYMYSIGRSDASLSAILSQAAGVAVDPPPPSQEEVSRIAEQVVAKGNAARGEIVFRRAELSCMRCHALNRAGGQVGPDLSAVGGSSPTDYIVNSILNPNLAVKEQYVTKIFVLASGRVLTGIVTDRDNNRVVIRDAQGKAVTIATADIDEEADGKSLMPQGLTKFLTHDEMLDLAKFISELGKPGTYEARKVPAINLWRVMSQPPDALIDEVPHLENIRELILASRDDQWISAYSQFSGTLPLAELRPSRAAAAIVVQGAVKVNDGGSISVDISCDGVFQAWMDDQPLQSKSSNSVSLEPGIHRLTLRIELSDKTDPGLSVQLVKPRDSTIQFEPVTGS